MKKAKIVLNTFFLFCLLSLTLTCKSTKSEIEQTETLLELERILNAKNYQIDITSVYPFTTAATTRVLNELFTTRTGNNAGRIDVIGDGYFIKMNKDKTKAHLPFFGEQRLSGGYYSSVDNGIRFDGHPENYDIAKHKKKNAFEIEFLINDTNQTTEAYNVKLLIFSNNSVDIYIASTMKTIIRYRGNLKVKESS